MALWSYEGNKAHPLDLEISRDGLQCAKCGALAIDHYVLHGEDDNERVALPGGRYVRPVWREDAIGGYSKASSYGLDTDVCDAFRVLGALSDRS